MREGFENNLEESLDNDLNGLYELDSDDSESNDDDLDLLPEEDEYDDKDEF